jgi:Holliday junction resolvase RusA-like endonuclease
MTVVQSHAMPPIAVQSGLYVKGCCHAFHIRCDPPKTSHHAKKIVRIGRFRRLADTDGLIEAKASLIELLRPHQPPEPMVGPIVLSIGWTWPWLGAHGQKLRRAGVKFHDHKPDLSNVFKTLEDRLVELRFIENDQSVVAAHLEKWWGDVPGLAITIATPAFYRAWIQPGAGHAIAETPRQTAPPLALPLEPEPGARGPEPELEPETA